MGPPGHTPATHVPAGSHGPVPLWHTVPSGTWESPGQTPATHVSARSHELAELRHVVPSGLGSHIPVLGVHCSQMPSQAELQQMPLTQCPLLQSSSCAHATAKAL